MAFSSYSIRLKAIITATLPVAVPPFFPANIPIPVELEASSYQSGWELNTIPSCTLTVPLGRRGDLENDPNGVSVIHWLVNYLQLMAPIQVYARVQPLDEAEGNPDRWPDGFFLVFDGYVTATGYRKAFGNAEFLIGGIHWLSNLDFSSAFSEVSHPLNPSQYTFKSFLPPLGIVAPAGGNNSPPLTDLQQAAGFFTPASVQTDFWAYGIGLNLPWGTSIKGGLKYWLEALASQKRFNYSQIAALTSGFVQEDGTNSNMSLALSKFEPIAIPGVPGLPAYTHGVPLAMRLGPASSVATDAIIAHIGKLTTDTWGGSTMWDKLVNQFANQYMLAIVPMIDRALVVPFNPFYRVPTKTIKASEYSDIELGTPSLRPVRGVGLIGSRRSIGGGDISAEPGSTYDGLDGFYEGRKNGMIIIMGGPEWMTELGAGTIAGQTSGVVIPKSNAFGVLAGGLPFANVSPKVDFKTASQDLCSKYAKARYLHEVLRGRQGSVIGKLRFDICPGSIVEIEGSAESFVSSLIGNDETAEQKKIAMVQRVSINLDANAKKASTAFHIAFHRTEYENSSDAYSSNEHPLWSVPWSGAPLLGATPEFI